MEPGNLIAGRYRLEQRLAAGGMGAVWRGTDTRLNRVVAIKLLHSGLSGNDRFRARFHQEAQAVAQLQSPGIVGLYDYGEEQAPEGLVSYLIMELVRGEALDNVLRQRGRLSPNETLKIMASAAEALDVAHQAHIIHRDIKPGNLLVGSDGSVKVVDFGIAAAKGGAGLTETGTVMGTLAYASPEQLQGAQLTGATDLYSLGIVGYECLAGRPPFAGNEPTAAIAGHLTGQPGPLPPDVPGQVGQIIMRLLAKDPRQRFASAAELAQVCKAGGMGGGTTAMLAPAGPPPGFPSSQSPQATQVMSPGGAGAMGAGIVAAHTSPHRMQQDEYGTAGTGQYRTGANPERPLPPPRDAEKPKRNPTGPILVVVAGIAIILIALFMTKPWDKSGEENDPTAGDNGSSDAASDAAQENSAAEETSEDDSGGDSEEDNSDDNGGNEEGENSGEETTEEDPQPVELEDYSGWDVNEAMADLQEKGFTDVFPSATQAVDLEHDTCEVLYQDPESGTEVGYDTSIMLEYVANDDSCPDGNLGG